MTHETEKRIRPARRAKGEGVQKDGKKTAIDPMRQETAIENELRGLWMLGYDELGEYVFNKARREGKI